jgi:hypothetical protein
VTGKANQNSELHFSSSSIFFADKIIKLKSWQQKEKKILLIGLMNSWLFTRLSLKMPYKTKENAYSGVLL